MDINLIINISTWINFNICDDIDMDISIRLSEIIKYFGLSVRAFAIKCGISQPTLDKQLKGQRAISLDTVLNVLKTYPEISAEWLLRGVGNMIKDKNSTHFSDEEITKMINFISAQQD